MFYWLLPSLTKFCQVLLDQTLLRSWSICRRDIVGVFFAQDDEEDEDDDDEDDDEDDAVVVVDDDDVDDDDEHRPDAASS